MFSFLTAAIIVLLGGAQIWRLYTEPYRFEWNISEITRERSTHRPETWRNCLLFNLLSQLKFVVFIVKKFQIYFLIAWQWKPAIKCSTFLIHGLPDQPNFWKSKKRNSDSLPASFRSKTKKLHELKPALWCSLMPYHKYRSLTLTLRSLAGHSCNAQ